MKTQDVFFEMECLTEESRPLSGLLLQKKWFKKSDKRYLGQAIIDFININKKNFEFLNVTPFIVGEGNNLSIRFRSDKYIGAIPLKSPDTGKQIGDFIVQPRFLSSRISTDYIELIYLLKSEIQPEFLNTSPLSSGDKIKPPLFYDSLIFVDLLFKTVISNWRKFKSLQKIYDFPKSDIDWDKYIEQEWNPSFKLKYPCHDNILSINHIEFSTLKYVFDLAKKEIFSIKTPPKLRKMVEAKVNLIEKYLELIQPIQVNIITLKNSDPIIVKRTKEQANKVLNFNLRTSKAWRIDFSLVFEKFVQLIFNKVALRFGGVVLSNYKFKRRSYDYPSWSLSHLEPDIVLKKDDFMVMVDAKYKSNIYNMKNPSNILKDEHRKDLHQLIAYTSFENLKNRIGVLCYPSSKPVNYQLNYHNPLNNLNLILLIFGIPLEKDSIYESEKNIYKEVAGLYKTEIIGNK